MGEVDASTGLKQDENGRRTIRRSWHEIVHDIIDAVARSSTNPEDVMNNFTYALQRHYKPKRFRVIISSMRQDGHSHIIRQEGFPVSKDELEKMMYENRTTLMPFEITSSARFVDDYDEEVGELEGNVFDEGRVAYLPIMYANHFYGWLVLSSYEKGIAWDEAEHVWLPLLSYMCGGFCAMLEREAQKTEEAIEQARQAWKETMRHSFDAVTPQTFHEIDKQQAASFNPKQFEAFRQSDASAAIDDRLKQLTARECEILQLIANGLTNNEISHRLCISEHTTKKHIENILGKLKVKNRTQAARLFTDNIR